MTWDEIAVWAAGVSCVANTICAFWAFRQIRAYYRAQQLLMDLCMHAWRLRVHGDHLWNTYERTIGSSWRATRGKPRL